MSLRTDYTGGLDTALAAARAAGNTMITGVTEKAALSAAMATASSKGQ